MSDYNFFCMLLSTDPFHEDYKLPCYELALSVLSMLYSPSIMECITKPHFSAAEKSKQVRKDTHIERAIIARQFETDKQSSWPTKVPLDVVFDCLYKYVTGTEWKPPPVCAVCSRNKDDV